MDDIHYDYRGTCFSIHYLYAIMMLIIFCIHCVTIVIFDSMAIYKAKKPPFIYHNVIFMTLYTFSCELAIAVRGMTISHL